MKVEELDTAGLTGAQRTVLRALERSAFGSTCYLTGGTALAAFWLHHRVSDDLDLFSDEDVPMTAIDAFVRALPAMPVRTYRRLYDRNLFLLETSDGPLKVEFTKYPFPRTRPLATLASGLRLDPPDEIFVNKLAAMAERREPKDDVDLYFLLRRTPGMTVLGEAIVRAESKFGLRGLRYVLQPRLLAVASALPPTTPPVSRDDVAQAFREELDALVAASLPQG